MTTGAFWPRVVLTASILSGCIGGRSSEKDLLQADSKAENNPSSGIETAPLKIMSEDELRISADRSRQGDSRAGFQLCLHYIYTGQRELCRQVYQDEVYRGHLAHALQYGRMLLACPKTPTDSLEGLFWMMLGSRESTGKEREMRFYLAQFYATGLYGFPEKPGLAEMLLRTMPGSPIGETEIHETVADFKKYQGKPLDDCDNASARQSMSQRVSPLTPGRVKEVVKTGMTIDDIERVLSRAHEVRGTTEGHGYLIYYEEIASGAYKPGSRTSVWVGGEQPERSRQADYRPLKRVIVEVMGNPLTTTNISCNWANSFTRGATKVGRPKENGVVQKKCEP